MNPLDHFKQYDDYDEYKHLLPQVCFDEEEREQIKKFKSGDTPHARPQAELLAEVEENRTIKEEVSITEKD